MLNKDEPKYQGSAAGRVLRFAQNTVSAFARRHFLFPVFFLTAFIFFFFPSSAQAKTCTYGDSLATAAGGLGSYADCAFATQDYTLNQVKNAHYPSIANSGASTIVVSVGANDIAGGVNNSQDVATHLKGLKDATNARVVYVMPPNASDAYRKTIQDGAAAGGYEVYTPPASKVAGDGVHLNDYKGAMEDIEAGDPGDQTGGNNPGCPVPTSSGGQPPGGTSSGGQSSGGTSSGGTSSSGGPSGEPFQEDGRVDDNNQNCQRTCPGCCNCHTPITNNHKAIRAHTTAEFNKYRDWVINNWWVENVVPALKVMTSQMTAVAVDQVMMVGALLDAKHQLETQRIFQEMTALAHKDYHPSEGLCVFGTNIRGLAASERLTATAHVGIAQRLQQRQLMTGTVVSMRGKRSDKDSRLKHYRQVYCNKADNGKGLTDFCLSGGAKRPNKDIDFTNTVEDALTLDLDMGPNATDTTEDEEDILALGANLFGHDIIPYYEASIYAAPDGRAREDALPWYMKARSLIARRAVAQDTFAALTAMRAKGQPDAIPFMRAILKELGLDPTETDKFIGEEPSYFAQMEVMTKEIFKNPTFYVDLYDKPANIERKAAVLDALGLMQDRDIYNSLLRSEANLAVLLENHLHREQQRVGAEIRRVSGTGEKVQ